MLRNGRARLFVGAAATSIAASAAVHGAFEGAALAVRLRVVNFEAHLLEQTSPLTSILTAIRIKEEILVKNSWRNSICLKLLFLLFFIFFKPTLQTYGLERIIGIIF